MKGKRFASWLLICLLLLSFVIPRAEAADADTVYVRKHVSLVYDNSGSMSQELDNAKNLKWTYASYAAQIFAGLLNETDSLTMTLMNENKGTKTLEVDLAGDRQKQVDQLRELTNYAKGGTPFNSVADAEQALIKKGLLADAQIGDNAVNKSEQFWLVLTTDGQFEDGTKTVEETERDLEALLKKYSNLQLVYFGIGTEGDNSDQAAIDLRNSDRLNAYPNFTAVYAEKQEQIVSTMQELANRISGRYSVTKGIKFDGKEVTLRISGESSPIRNVAVLAQRTDTKLLSAVDEDGHPLTVARTANEQFPHNNNYDNIAAGTKGAHTALITDPDGKFEPGTVKLTFSEPVTQDDFCLMYEPAVYIQLTIEQKDASGNWVKVPYGQKVQSNAPLRVGYEICEDGTNTPVDAAKLPGVTTEHITCGDKVLSRNGEFAAPTENSTITATVSLMDGNYVVSTVRALQVVALDDYTFSVSDPLSFYPNELATNTAQYIDFKVLYQGQPATADQTTSFSVEAGDLQGTLSTPDPGVFRFTPKQEGVEPGEMTVNLCFLGQSVASQKVTVKEMVVSYDAKAGDDLTLFSNEVAGNTKPIVFSVTRTLGEETLPLPEEDAGQFTVEAKSADGTVLKGVTSYVGGQIHFTTDDANAQVGEYTVTLYWQEKALASANISILKYNAQFTAEVFRVGEGTVDLFDLRSNQSALAFVIYADGEPCTGVQLEGMLGGMLRLEHDAPKSIMRLDISVGTYEGKAALLVRPTSSAKSAFGAWLQKFSITSKLLLGSLKDSPLTVELTVQAEKGTQISGTLDMFHDPAAVIPFLILALMMMLILGVILYLAYCNVHKPRIAPGVLRCYALRKDESEYIMEGKPSEAVSRRFCWNIAPEQQPVNGLLLRAPENTQSGLYRRPEEPLAVITYTGKELENYFYLNRGEMTNQFLTALQQTAVNNRIACEEVDAMMQISAEEGRTPLKPGETGTYMPRLKSGAVLMRKSSSNMGDKIEVWTYSAKRNND